MRLRKKNGWQLLAVFISITACQQQSSADDGTEAVDAGSYTNAGEDRSADEINLADFSADDASAQYTDRAGEMNSFDTLDSRASSEIWSGMSGVPQGCVLTNYHHLEDVRAVMEEDGATITKETPNMIIVAQKAPNGSFKSVFATTEALCSVVVTRRDFARPPSPANLQSENRAEQ